MPDTKAYGELERLARSAQELGQIVAKLGEEEWYDADALDRFHVAPEDAAYIAAASPATILAMIEENRALRARAERAEERVRDAAALMGVPDAGAYLNDWIDRDISAPALI